MISLEGQNILVTGASRGIGAAIAGHILEAGGSVAAHYNSAPGRLSELIERYGPERCRAVQADFGEPGAIDACFAAAAEWSGGLDGLVNNAAIIDTVSIDDPIEDWRQAWARTMAVNSQAVADLCRHALLHFRARNGGMIVNISSRAAFRGDAPDSMHYAASKAAVVALTRSIAKGYAKDGVCAYVIAPGWVETSRVMPKLTAPGNEAIIGEIPMGRPAPPGEVGNLVVFLLSGAARHATGATFDINGASYFH